MRALRDLLGGRDGAKLGAMPSDATPPPQPPQPSQPSQPLPPPQPSSGPEPARQAPASGNGTGNAGKQTVLVVDDEPAVRDALRRSLSFEGYATQLAADGAEALEKVAEHQPDLVVLDVLMPRMDGLTAARRLRAAGQRVPVLMLTARDTVGDRVTGLDAGADDYLVKPFELDELLARVRALLRRSSYARAQAQAEAAEEPETLAFADLRMDLLTREVTRGGRPVELTRTEYTLLEMFLAHPRQVLTREQILKAVWGFDFEPSSNSLDVYVMYLRRKTEAGGEPRLVHTVRGVGYVLRDDT
ncbi:MULTISPECIES: response regulator transcription factor [Streptomyces]|uniref:response regulator transcription factor n=1 Tax=Streptomyces TaxID=1883 RepID=UPI0004155C06|nr:response regulator transcription factor [Streptomyces qinglanensis]OEV25480.1 transcriptional regulator [Streptomyces nanshensis]